jgi:hypothetical protein
MRVRRRGLDVGGHRAAAVGRGPGVRCGRGLGPVDRRAVGYLVDVNLADHVGYADQIILGEPDAEPCVANPDTDEQPQAQAEAEA